MKKILLLSVFAAVIATVIIPVLVSISDIASAQGRERMGSCYDKNAKKIPCPK